MSEAEAHTGVDQEAVMQPITPMLMAECRQALGLTISLLLSPAGTCGKSGDKAFYANLIMNMDRTITNNIPGFGPLHTAAVSIQDRIQLYINPHFFLGLTENKRIEVLIHECEHIMLLHPLDTKKRIVEEGGEKANIKNVLNLTNIAQDALINIPLKDLTATLGVTIERLNAQLEQKGSSIRIEPTDNSAIIYWKLRQYQEESGDSGEGMGEGADGQLDDHGVWKNSEGNEELAKATVRSAANKAAAATGVGNCPMHIQQQLNELNKSLVNWKREIQKFAVRTLKFDREGTRSRRNRRTGIINPGSRKKPKVKLAFIGDESGSMCNKQVAQVHAEVEKVASMGIEVYYIPMDSTAGEVVKFKKGMKLERTRSGGTYYNPPLKVAAELGVDAVIFLGDFDCADSPEKPKFPVLWIGVNTNTPAPADFGSVIYVDTK